MECKYRVRWFSSKGAFLVLLWTSLIFIVFGSFTYNTFAVSHAFSSPLGWLLLIPMLMAFVAAPLSGWLADAKFGNYKVFRVGAVLLFIATVMNCLLLILETLVLETNAMLKWVFLCFVYSFLAIGGCACVVTLLPLGLDQMPDASSSSIASYIAWVVFSLFLGGLVGEGFELPIRKCIHDEVRSSYVLIQSLIFGSLYEYHIGFQYLIESKMADN